MRKILVSVAVILSFIGYFFRQRLFVSAEPPANTNEDPGTTNLNSPPVSNANTGNQTPLNANVSSQTNTNAPAVGEYRDGTYTGIVADAFYGLLQVSTTIRGGEMTDIDFLRYPDDRPNSIAVNTRAIPLLREEALTAQSADIDIVTGATESSIAFRQSLQSALDQAQ